MEVIQMPDTFPQPIAFLKVLSKCFSKNSTKSLFFNRKNQNEPLHQHSHLFWGNIPDNVPCISPWRCHNLVAKSTSAYKIIIIHFGFLYASQSLCSWNWLWLIINKHKIVHWHISTCDPFWTLGLPEGVVIALVRWSVRGPLVRL